RTCILLFHIVFFLTDTPTSELSTLSLHDALPILAQPCQRAQRHRIRAGLCRGGTDLGGIELLLLADARRCRQRDLRPQGGRHLQDRKSTRLNSSHVKISYAVFCLKKKNIKMTRNS